MIKKRERRLALEKVKADLARLTALREAEDRERENLPYVKADSHTQIMAHTYEMKRLGFMPWEC